MLDFPQTTAPKPRFPLRFPKQKFYEHLDIPSEIRQMFVDQIRLIYWTTVLSPVSLNIASGEAVEEIDVLKILLQGQDLDERVLQLIERQQCLPAETELSYRVDEARGLVHQPDCTGYGRAL